MRALVLGPDKRTKSEIEPEGRRWGRRSPYDSADNKAKSNLDAKWNFAFGANINPWKLRERRKINPLEQVPGKVSGWRLAFNHKGGMGNMEPRPTGAADLPDAVHGMLLLLTVGDFEKLAQMEHEYMTSELTVTAYDGRTIKAFAFTSPPQWKLPTYPAPPERYLRLIQEGARDSQLDSAYQAWLSTLPSVKGQRSPEYYAVQGDSSHREKGERRLATADLGSRLSLAAAGASAVGPLIDIGANMTKCSTQDFAAQLARASAAQVEALVLTGCSIKGSQDCRRLCDEWTALNLARLGGLLGATARQELQDFQLGSLPRLYFTAGVHPHDVKGCDEGTLPALRELARHPRCVSIGECGLDYDRLFSPRETQLAWCRAQTRLAVELGKPLFLHERDRDASGSPLGSAEELLQILADAKVEPSKVCVHCFTGSEETLRMYLERGYYIGLTGFAGMKRRGAHIRSMLSKGILPLERLLLETDCPFMLPDQDYLPSGLNLGKKNEPCVMPAVCSAVAECLGLPPGEVARATTANARRFFSLT